jgi:hypothetical protein
MKKTIERKQQTITLINKYHNEKEDSCRELEDEHGT